MSRRRALEILRILQKDYPDVGSELNYENPFQLLVATMLAPRKRTERSMR